MNARRVATSIELPIRAAPAPVAADASVLRVNWMAVAVAATALAQGAAIAFAWGAMSNRVSSLEKELAGLAGVPAAIATLDERSAAQGEALKHLVSVQDGQREDAALSAAVRRWARDDAGGGRRRR